MPFINEMKVPGIAPNPLDHDFSFGEKPVSELAAALHRIMIKYLAQVPLNKRVKGKLRHFNAPKML